MKVTVGKLKKKLWKLFSKYIRQRDNYTCVTCGQKGEGSGIHAGHYITKAVGGIGLYFHEQNVHAQCLTEESSLRLFNGKSKSIKQIKKGDKLWSFDESSFERKVSFVQEVSKFLPEELYQVEMENGDMFFATPNHKVVANGKWVEIKDMLHSVTTYNIMEM